MKDERGYSLMAILIALAVSGLIISGIVVAIHHIYNVSSDRTNQIVAIREVQNAGTWLTRDAQKASTIATTLDADGFPLTLNWADADENQYEVIYTLLPGNELQREHYTNKISNPDPDATTIVAYYVDLDNTSCNISENDELVANVTTAVNAGDTNYTETRTYRVFPRGSLQ